MEDFQAEIRAEIEAFVGPGGADSLGSAALEAALKRRAMEVTTRAVQ